MSISKLLNGDGLQVSKEKGKTPENSIIGVRERIFINLYLSDIRGIAHDAAMSEKDMRNTLE